MSSSQANPQSNTPSSSASSMYSASVNPPRKAKLQAAASLLPALLPSPPRSDSSSSSSNFSISIVAPTPESVQPKKKRGRKPSSGGSSRAAREATRKANHSRIEKARRGKINDALQELKRLIPADFAAGRENGEDDDDDDEDADFAPAGSSKKESGKKGASEREFKLDILERTVLFVRALLKRVDENGQPGDCESSKQASNCNCQCRNVSNERGLKKRKVMEQEERAQAKKRRITSQVEEERVNTSDIDDVDSETGSCADTDDDNDTTEDVAIVNPSHSRSNEHPNRVRLPSISELLSSPVEIGSSRMYTQQLPSPSLSPQTSPRYYTGQKSSSNFVSSFSSPIFPQVRSLASAETEDAPHPCEAHDGSSDSRISYPVTGMSYLLTPPSPNTTSNSNPHARTPAFRLPSSALELRDVSEERVVTSGTEIDVDTEDGGARTATLALLQMHSTSYSRAGTQSSAVKEKDKTRTAKTSLTPGGLLGIQTGERPR